jgi:hypothetical protein
VKNFFVSAMLLQSMLMKRVVPLRERHTRHRIRRHQDRRPLLQPRVDDRILCAWWGIDLHFRE